MVNFTFLSNLLFLRGVG